LGDALECMARRVKIVQMGFFRARTDCSKTEANCVADCPPAREFVRSSPAHMGSAIAFDAHGQPLWLSWSVRGTVAKSNERATSARRSIRIKLRAMAGIAFAGERRDIGICRDKCLVGERPNLARRVVVSGRSVGQAAPRWFCSRTA